MAADDTANAAKFVGCTQDPDSQEAVDCLQGVPFEKLTEAPASTARQARSPFGELFLSPSYDGDCISDRPSMLLRKAAFVKGFPALPLPTKALILNTKSR